MAGLTHQNKIAVLQQIKSNKAVLFGAFSDSLTKEDKVKKWKEIAEFAQSLGIGKDKEWHYVRDTVWANWRKRTLEKKDNAKQTGSAGGKNNKLTDLDHLVIDILGTDNPVVRGLGRMDSLGMGGTYGGPSGPTDQPGTSASGIESFHVHDGEHIEQTEIASEGKANDPTKKRQTASRITNDKQIDEFKKKK